MTRRAHEEARNIGLLGQSASRRARRGRVTKVAAAGALPVLMAAGLTACGGSSSSSTGASAGSSPSTTSGSSSPSGMPAASFFKGKTITLIAPDKPGGDGDLSARAIAPGLAQELHATVNVTNMPGGGSVVGTNALYGDSPNGLTLGIVHLGTDVAGQAEHRLTGVKFDLSKFSWIGNETEQPFVVGTQPNGPYKTFADLVHTSSPNTVITSTTDYGINVIIYSVFNIKHKFLTGYPSGSDEKQGFLANQGQNFNSFAGIVSSMIQSHQMKALAITSTPTLASLKTVLAGVPTVTQEVSKLGLSLSSTAKSELQEAITLPEYFASLAAPPGLSAAKLETLRTAFSKAMTLSSTKALASKSREPQYFVSGTKTASEVSSMISGAKVLGSLAAGS